MHIEQSHWTIKDGWHSAKHCEHLRTHLLSEAIPIQDDWHSTPPLAHADLVLVFGGTDQLDMDRLDELRARYPGAILFGCSTAGEILGEHVHDDTIAATAIHFEHTSLHLASQTVPRSEDSRATGRTLAARLPVEGLSHILVLASGLHVNGSELVEGIKAGLPAGVEVTGGLSGDAARFQRTFVIANGPPQEYGVAALGLYGDRIRVGHGCLGGWDPFGPDRLITRSKGNVLYELDGQSALALYKQYLGDHAAGLPASALLFPLALHREGEADAALVRAILAVDEQEQSMTFAGDVPEGQYARLMRANFDRLVEGALGAAREAAAGLRGGNPQLALLISCVARKLVLSQRVEEEVEGVREVLGDAATLTGFYSYGEISPYTPTARCELHNQTMTITTLSEE